MFAGDRLCPCDWKETAEEPRNWNKGGGEKARGCHPGVMDSAAIFIMGQVTRDLVGELSSLWDVLDETQLRRSMPVLAEQRSRFWIWSCLKV